MHDPRRTRGRRLGPWIRGAVAVAASLVAPLALAATAGEQPEVLGIPGLIGHLAHEWVILANLLCLLLGFALLSRHFEDVGWHPTPKRGDPPLAPPAAQQPR